MPTPYITVRDASDMTRARVHIRKKLSETGRVQVNVASAYLGSLLRQTAYAWARQKDVHITTSHKTASGQTRFRAAITGPRFEDDDE
jgi:hypothetical protein